ncbi:MAG: membrane protein insertase YidC [Muricoprocola sp.]
MKTTLLTKSETFIIGPVATLLGFIINALYMFMHGVFNIQNIGICIILFTIVVNILLLPLTIKQQKSSLLTQAMNPEIQAIAKKYKNKNDQESMMKMQQEQQAVYEKYGVSPMGTCLPMLIQMPILFAMYQVIMKIPAYVKSVKEIYTVLVDQVLASTQMQEFLTQFATAARVNLEKVGFTNNSVVDILHSLTPANWTEFANAFPNAKTVIEQTSAQAAHVNNFLSINIADAPMTVIKNSFISHAWLPLIVAIMIPILAGLTQYLNTKLIPQAESSGDGSDAMASSMKTMNMVMPLMSVFFCFTFSMGIGIYWVASSAVRCVIQVIVNKKMEKVDIDEMVKENLKKYNEKRVKQGLRPEDISGQAKKNLKNLKNPVVESEEAIQERNEKRLAGIKESTEYYNKTAKPGSIAAKARMVEQYNERYEKNRKAYKK